MFVQNGKPDLKVDRKRKMMDRDLLQYGTWVQCCNRSCKKWRYLCDVNDPSVLPENWFCTMNTDTDYNECDKAEQTYNEEEHIYTNYAEGTVVWARMSGFPWWPAMIEMDPDTEYYFELENPESMFPSHYHVVFFDERVSRAWIRSSCIQPFIGKENLNCLTAPKKSKLPSYKSEIAAAKAKASHAIQLDLQERLRTFSFCQRYKGKWGKDESEKRVLKPNHKKTKTVSSKTNVEVVDDTTVEDLLNNPSSILNSLDDVLDSLESFTDDSDFKLSDEETEEDIEEDEQIGGLKKGTRTQNENSGKTCSKSENIEQEEQDKDDLELELQEEDSNSDAEFSEVSDTGSESKTLSKKHRINRTSNKCRMSTGPHKKLKLDPEVFTMDMETGEASQSQERKDSQQNAVKADEKGSLEEQRPMSPQTEVKPALQKKLKINKISPVAHTTINIDHKGDTGELKPHPEVDSYESISLFKNGDQGGKLLKQEKKQNITIKTEEEELFIGPENDPQEQAVPSAEADFLHSEDLGFELSLEFDVVPKPQAAIEMSIGAPLFNEVDEDSDPFEMIEE